MRSELFFIGLGVFAFGCSRASPPSKTADAAKEPARVTAGEAPKGRVSLELQKGPPPQLPSPMLVADSVHGGTFETCYQNFRPTGNARNDLAQMAGMCGNATSMKPVTAIIEGAQSQTEPIARYTFQGELGHCYRIFSASDRGIRDLDLAILDPSQTVVGHDTNEDAFPMVNPDGPLCLTRPGSYTLLVSVERGAGHYALQVWGF